MVTYLYDGSFEGLLTAVYEAFYAADRPEKILSASDYQPMLGETVQTVERDVQKAEKVGGAIVEKLSPEIFKLVMYAYFSEESDAGEAIYRFLRVAFKHGAAIIGYESEPAVHRLLKLSRSVSNETHRMLGLVRFMKLASGIYYSRLEPTRDILPMLATHFKDRLSTETWVIHDLKRQKAAFYDQKQWFIRDLATDADIHLHPEETAMQDLWKEYFKRIAIQERINPALQRGRMPKKYWKYLVEKQ